MPTMDPMEVSQNVWAAFTRPMNPMVGEVEAGELRALVKATTELRDVTRECMNAEDYDEYFDGSRVETAIERVDDALMPFKSVCPPLGGET